MMDGLRRTIHLGTFALLLCAGACQIGPKGTKPTETDTGLSGNYIARFTRPDELFMNSFTYGQTMSSYNITIQDPAIPSLSSQGGRYYLYIVNIGELPLAPPGELELPLGTIYVGEHTSESSRWGNYEKENVSFPPTLPPSVLMITSHPNPLHVWLDPPGSTECATVLSRHSPYDLPTTDFECYLGNGY